MMAEFSKRSLEWIRYLPHWWQGAIQMAVVATTLPRWLPVIQEAQIPLFHLHYGDQQTVIFTVAVPDAQQVLQILRYHQVEAEIVQQTGWPACWRWLLRRKVFFISACMAGALLWFLSSLIWRIDIEGAVTVSPAYIRTLLLQEGVFVGQFQKKVFDVRTLLHRLRNQMPDIAWLGIRREGIRVVVTIVEKHAMGKIPDRLPMLDTQGNLVSRRGATVLEVLAERGNPQVDVYDVVEPGQVLIAGFYGDTTKPDQMIWVGARGRVMGEAWYIAQVEVPLRSTRRIYTGRYEKRIFPYVSMKILRFLDWEKPYTQQTTLQRMQPLRIGPWELPLGWIEEEYWETDEHTFQRTPLQAVHAGREQARETVLQTVGIEGKILHEKILHQYQVRGKVVLSMHFAVSENIAIPRAFAEYEKSEGE